MLNVRTQPCASTGSPECHPPCCCRCFVALFSWRSDHRSPGNDRHWYFGWHDYQDSLKPEVSVRKCTSRCARSLHWPSKAFEKFHPRASTQKCQSLVGAKPLQRSSHGVWQTPEPHQSTPDNRKHQFYVQSKLASLMCFNTAWRIEGSFSTRSTSKLSCIKSSKTKAMAFLPNWASFLPCSRLAWWQCQVLHFASTPGAISKKKLCIIFNRKALQEGNAHTLCRQKSWICLFPV